MHAQQSFLNVCNTAILGYHGDQIILYKNVKNIKCHKSRVIKLSNMSRFSLSSSQRSLRNNVIEYIGKTELSNSFHV